MQREEEERDKKQMTFGIFVEWIRLRPKEAFVGYISGIMMDFDLAGLWKKKELFCMPCDCGHVVFGNTMLGECKACSASSMNDKKIVSLSPNPQILAAVSDETGGFTQGHNLLVADAAWTKLLGRSQEQFEKRLETDGSPYSFLKKEQMLMGWEQRLRYLRLTFVTGWSGTGKWSGGRMIVLDVLDDRFNRLPVE